jgi:hypothetical protein
MKLPSSLILAFVTLVYPAWAGDSPMPAREAILNRIHILTGLDTLFAVESIEGARASDADIPFLGKELEGKAAIKITFKRGKLKLKSVPAGKEDKYSDRQFIVLLDAEANKLLSVTSTIVKKDPQIHPEKSRNEIETELGRNGEYYKAFPESDPKFAFLEALEITEKSIASPYAAQQIDAYYVVHPQWGGVSRPLWIVTMRGSEFSTGPTFPVPPNGEGPHQEPLPDVHVNYIRILIDAMDGKWLSASNSPSPKP